jgi:hypothetical protein
MPYGLKPIQNKEGWHLVYITETEDKEDNDDSYTIRMDQKGQFHQVNVGKAFDRYVAYKSVLTGSVRRIELMEYSPITDNVYRYPYDVYKNPSSYDDASHKQTTEEFIAEYRKRNKTG